MLKMKKIYWFLFGIEALFLVIATLYNLFGLFNGQYFLQKMMCLILFGGIVWYVVEEFKQPHGNLLKYLFMFYCVLLFVDAIMRYNTKDYLGFFADVVSIAIMCYASGRLNRKAENAIYFGIVLTLLFVSSVSMHTKEVFYNGALNLNSIALNDFTLYSAVFLVSAYFIRYKNHQEAGIKR